MMCREKEAGMRKSTKGNNVAVCLCIAVLAFFFSTLPASAMVVAQTDGFPGNIDMGLSPNADTGDLSFSFTTDANDYTFNAVTLFLSFGEETADGSFSVFLTADGGNAPGAPLEELAGDSHPTGNDAEYQYTGSSTLTANTTYWITLSNSDLTFSNMYDFWTATTTAESAASVWRIGDDVYSSLNGFQDIQGPFVSRFDATLQAVPLPASAFLLFSGLLGLTGLRRR